jgi:hypothetical protein
MDPNACLERIAKAKRRTDSIEACQDLIGWLGKGGFAPDWAKNLEGTRKFRIHLAHYVPGGEARYLSGVTP